MPMSIFPPSLVLPSQNLKLKLTLSLALTAFSSALYAGPHHCSSDALAHGKALLALHSDNDERAELDPNVKTIAPLTNPIKKTQKFDVLEVNASIYKGSYRMRFIYAQFPDSCVLIGQEILELTTL
jgi:hypothetical protein